MTVRLSDIFRQAQDSTIVTNAHLINQGEMPVCDNKKDFFFLKRNNAKDLCDLVVNLCIQRLPEAYGFDALSDVQIICPTRKGQAGTVAINSIMQNLVNPAQKGVPSYSSHNVTFRKGDKVMVIRNNYDIEWIDENKQKGAGVFNGDIGFIVDIDTEGQAFYIRFDDGRLAGFDFTCFEDIEHAYAITVHKSQGSEYKAVVVPFFDCPPGLLSRNMLYTAVTRAEQIVVLCGKQELIGQMVSNNRRSRKYSGLFRMLSAIKKKRDSERIDKEEALREQE
jgi:exodeoxyribonuclease V alpha subunit